MSTANVVPETHDLEGDDARRVLKHAHIGRVLKDSALRFRWADGFSHSRALAFQTVLTLIPGIIVAAGVATITRNTTVSDTILRAIQSLAPGPTGDVFRSAVQQGASSGGADTGRRALIIGALVMMVSASTTFGQIERGANRIYGVEKDRPSLRKYSLAVVLSLTAGAALTAAFLLLAFGRSIDHEDGGALSWAWVIVRWPLGAVFLTIGYALIFRMSPRRRQPSASWLAFGAALSVAITVVVSVGLAYYLNVSSSFGDTYGPLAGFMGVMLWAYLSAIGLFLGLAFGAELEAVRAGVPEPQSALKVAITEPAPAPTGTAPGVFA